MEGGDVRIADKNLWIVPEDFRLEIRKHSYGTVPTCATDHCLDPRIEPHSHEVRGATFIFLALKSSELRNVGIEDHFVSSALECFHSPHEWSIARRVRW